MDERFFTKYVWHDDKNQQSVEKHGLSFQSAVLAMEHGNPVPTGNQRDDGRNEHYACLNGEGVKVISEPQGEDTRIISAHRRTQNARDLFAQEYEKIAQEKGISKNGSFQKDYAEWRQLDKDQKDRSESDVEKIKDKHLSEQKQFATQKGVTLDEAKAALADQQKAEAVEDRKPRLERDGKERAELSEKQRLREGKGKEEGRGGDNNPTKEPEKKSLLHWNRSSSREESKAESQSPAHSGSKLYWNRPNPDRDNDGRSR